MSLKVSQYLAERQSSADLDTAAVFSKLEEFYNKKLWHQLTLAVLEALKQPYFTDAAGNVKSLYGNFIYDFEHRINPLALMEIALFVIRDTPDPEESIAFVERIKGKVKGHKEASVLAETALGNIYIMKRDLAAVKSIIERTEDLMSEFDGVTSVHSRFYELSSDYYKICGDHANYYRQALRFLGCVELSTLPPQRQLERAYSLSLAALLGDGVYNFGELLAHPILDSIKGTDKQWIVDLLYAFNSGSLAKFESYASYWKKQPDLAAAELKLRQKVCLLCLMEMTFTRPSNSRQLSFQEISNETKLPIDEVELLVMKALSLNLVKGHIDQVDETVSMTWVQPRVLNLEQISGMCKRVDQWCKDVKGMEMLVENKAHDILT